MRNLLSYFIGENESCHLNGTSFHLHLRVYCCSGTNEEKKFHNLMYAIKETINRVGLPKEMVKSPLQACFCLGVFVEGLCSVGFFQAFVVVASGLIFYFSLVSVLFLFLSLPRTGFKMLQKFYLIRFTSCSLRQWSILAISKEAINALLFDQFCIKRYFFPLFSRSHYAFKHKILLFL